VPESDAELISTVLTSLAMKYRQVYDSFKPYIHWEEKVYMIGGGINNKVLCQFTANALGVPVITGASEATAAGNIMQQLKAVGEYNSEDDKSRILIDSFGSKVYEPCDTGLWEAAYDKYKQVILR
jgi:sugar (pentulose or hexulose) kinase